MKLTKIIATIGPASESKEKIAKLIEEGVDIFRFNLKHNDLNWHKEKIELVCKVADKLKKTIGILIDLQGPEIRFKIPQNELSLKINDEILLSEEGFLNKKAVSFSHPVIIKELKDGQKVLVDDGKFEFFVKRKKENVYLISLSEGTLGSFKSVTIPGLKANLPLLTKKDIEGIKLVQKIRVDFVALSFVRTKEDVINLRKSLNKLNINARIISKIETALAIENLKEIIEVSDGIMVARGDLGIELPLEEVGLLQKKIIRESRLLLKPVITATQMLESMVYNPYPTRAEISDITNAFFDGTDATMLSGETANGKYPINTIKIMKKTLSKVEKASSIEFIKYDHIFDNVKEQEKAIILSSYYLYLSMIEKTNHENVCFLIFTETGRSAHLLSRLRPKSPIFAITPNKRSAEFLTLNFGIYPFVDKNVKNGRVTHYVIDKKIEFLVKKGLIKRGLELIVLHGDVWGKVGGISTIRLVKV